MFFPKCSLLPSRVRLRSVEYKACRRVRYLDNCVVARLKADVKGVCIVV